MKNKCEFCETELRETCGKMYPTFIGGAKCHDNMGHDGPCGLPPIEAIEVRHSVTDCRVALVLQRNTLAAQLKELSENVALFVTALKRRDAHEKT